MIISYHLDLCDTELEEAMEQAMEQAMDEAERNQKNLYIQFQKEQNELLAKETEKQKPTTRPKLLETIQQDQTLLIQKNQEISDLNTHIEGLRQEKSTQTTRAQQAAAKLIELSLTEVVSNLGSRTQQQNNLFDKEKQHEKLKEQLHHVSSELHDVEADLQVRTRQREQERAVYINERQSAEHTQIQDLSECLQDMELYEDLLNKEENATVLLQQEIVSRRVTTQGSITTAYELEEQLVLSEQQELLDAWVVQELTLVESLQDIEEETLMLQHQSSALRKTVELEEKMGSERNCMAIEQQEMTAELYHISELMRSKHTELGLLKKKLAILEEERATVNVLVSTWLREQHYRSSVEEEEEKKSVPESVEGGQEGGEGGEGGGTADVTEDTLAAHLVLLRALAGKEEENDEENKNNDCQVRPEVLMMNHLRKMSTRTHWKRMEKEREQSIQHAARGGAATMAAAASSKRRRKQRNMLEEEQEEEEEEEEEEEQEEEQEERYRKGTEGSPANTTTARSTASATSPHAMWLGKQWRLIDQQEKEAETQFIHYIRRVKYQVDELLEVQSNVSARIKSSFKNVR